MNKLLHQLSESELTVRIKKAVSIEKRVSLKVLTYLEEVNLRRLYASQSYSSLFEYAVKELGYSESQASERVASMRLFQDFPEVKKLLSDGQLSMTTAAQIQRYFRNEKKFGEQGLSDEQKLGVIALCENKSKREVEKVLFKLQSDEVKVSTSERVRRVSETHFEFKFLVPEGVLDQINEVRNLIGETNLGSCFQNALEIYLEELRKNKHADKSLSGSVPFPEKDKNPEVIIIPVPDKVQTDFESNYSAGNAKSGNVKIRSIRTRRQHFTNNSRYVPRTVKRMLFARSQGQCEFVDPRSRNRCLSRYRIQIDHIIPYAVGGKTEIQNLRHLCQGHNLRSAYEWFPNKKPGNSKQNFRAS